MPEDNGETYTVTVTFSVGSPPGEHLADEEAVKGEITSWLESLDAEVHEVSVQQRKEKR